MHMQEIGCPWDGLKSQVPALRLCALELKHILDRLHCPWMRVHRQVMAMSLDEHGTGFGERSSLCLWVFSAWGCIPTPLPATGAAWESLNPLWTHSAAFLKGSKGSARADDCPEVRQGITLPSSLHQQRGGTGEPVRASQGLEAEMMFFQPKSARNVFPQHAMSLKPASATFDNSCWFS